MKVSVKYIQCILMGLFLPFRKNTTYYNFTLFLILQTFSIRMLTLLVTAIIKFLCRALLVCFESCV
jgi:hypothetical protein